jgi:hypothetical protein
MICYSARVTTVTEQRAMWTHATSRCCLGRRRTANLLQQEEVTEPQPDIEVMLERWDRLVDDFIVEPGAERMGPLKACMRELVQFASGRRRLK